MAIGMNNAISAIASIPSDSVKNNSIFNPETLKLSNSEKDIKTFAKETYERTGMSDGSRRDQTDRTNKVETSRLGNPNLSESTEEYLRELQERFDSMNFIVVDDDYSSDPRMDSASIYDSSKMTVIIDESRLSRMAYDSEYRDRVESNIAKAQEAVRDAVKNIGFARDDLAVYGMDISLDDKYYAVFNSSDISVARRLGFSVSGNSDISAEGVKMVTKTMDNASGKEPPYVGSSEDYAPKNSNISAANSYALKAYEATKAVENQKNQYTVNRNSLTKAGLFVDDDLLTAADIQGLISKVNEATLSWFSNNILSSTERVLGRNFDIKY